MDKDKRSYMNPDEMKSLVGTIIVDFIRNEMSRVRWRMNRQQVKNINDPEVPHLPSCRHPLITGLTYERKQGITPYTIHYEFYDDELCAMETFIPAWRVDGASMMPFVDLFLSMAAFLTSIYGDADHISSSPCEGKLYCDSQVSVYLACWDLSDFSMDLYLYVPEENQPLKNGLLNLDVHNSLYEKITQLKPLT